MFLLIGEFTHLFSLLPHQGESFIGTVMEQFHHHPWNGLRFWDLVQPYFMFIVGLSLPFAVASRTRKGEDRAAITKHVVKRSLILLLLGWGLYCIGPGEIRFYFQNVLAQIAVTYLIAYLIMDRSFGFQVIFSVALLVVTELLYRFWPVESFNQPFVIHHNFGTWLDQLYNGESAGGWVSFNAIPTAAHTIWGVLAGQLIMGNKTNALKLKYLLVAGGVLVLIGYLMDPVTPVIKRISTSSFVLVSGGWSILTLAFLFWLVDIRKINRGWPLFFTVVGMNSLFIYLFAHVGGAEFIEEILHPFSYALFGWAGDYTASIATAISVWSALWGLCYWMYKQRIFIKI